MPEPKTLPQHFGLPAPTPPNPSHDAWLTRAELLLASFERSNNRVRSPASASPSLGFIVMASDYLWDELAEAAEFGRLDVAGFTEHCRGLLAGEDTLSAFTDTLVAFYDFLAETDAVERELAHAITRQLRNIRADFTRPSVPQRA
jgi:hypothetical protein